jgi:DNA polymerase-4
VTLKVRYDDFSTVTRSRTLSRGVDGSRELYRIARELIDQCDLSRPIRLLGLGASALAPGAEARQLGLGASIEWDRVEETVASLRARYGDEAVRPARLLGDPTKDPD